MTKQEELQNKINTKIFQLGQDVLRLSDRCEADVKEIVVEIKALPKEVAKPKEKVAEKPTEGK